MNLLANNINARGYSGGFTDGRYAYLVPFAQLNGVFTRVNLQDFTASGVTFLDVSTSGNTNAKGFFGGFWDRQYAYLVPGYLESGQNHGILTRVLVSDIYPGAP